MDNETIAFDAMANAYAPYSRFRVGAVITGPDGRPFAGCNVENASYPAGLCAERAALAAGIAAGCRTFRELVIATEAEVATPPCGMCRQALGEFGHELHITSVTTGGQRVTWRLSELLPMPFTPASLEHV